MQHVAAILLAAGRSKRMGAFKPLLPFGDSTVIRTCVSTLRSAGLETIVVVIGHHGDEIRDHLKDLDVQFALNANPDSEMSASIACGVTALPAHSQAVLIALTDHPGVTGDVIKSLVTEWSNGKTLLLPEYQGHGGHPVLVDLSLRQQLLQLDPQRGLKSLFESRREEVQRVPVDCEYIARDMDKWDDYLRLHQDIFGELPTVESIPGLKEETNRQPN